MIKVLFVCLGNICRSPMADGLFQQMVKEAGLGDKISVDSCGTGDWHAGEPAHRGTRQVLAKHNIPYNGRSRQITAADMKDPNSYIIAMDSNNVAAITQRFGTHPRLFKLLDFAKNSTIQDVPDPYYTGSFDIVFDLVQDGCNGLLEKIMEDMEEK